VTTIVDRVPVERITAEARQVHLGRLLLTLLAGFFYVIGWVIAKFYLGVVWCCVAVKVGFQEGRKTATDGQRGSTG
jgi:hypothetical protein